MRTAAGWTALSALLLAGCAAPAPPGGPTAEEVSALLERQSVAYWESIAPGEPMPEIEPVRVVDDYAEQWLEVRDCLIEHDPAGLVLDDNVGWASASSDPEVLRRFERTMWECAARFPVDPASPDLEFTLSDAQADYLWDYFTTRLIPCIQAHGFPLAQIPSRDEYLSGRWWSPYFSLAQSPISPRDLAMLDASCPPPPIAVPRPF